MGECLLREDVKLKIADLNPAVTEKFVPEHPGSNVEVAPLEKAYYEEVDILCPCAIGGIFHDENIPRLRCRYIWGSANNQLKASSHQEEIRLSRLLAEHDILFQTEWWHNTAGIICRAQEYINGANATYEELIRGINATMPQSTYENLVEAQQRGSTPCENVYRKCESVVYGD